MKKNDSILKLLVRGAALTLAAGLLAGGTGCGSDAYRPQLTLQSLQGTNFTQQFSKAYLSHDKDGDTDLVLVDQATEDALNGRHGAIDGNVSVRQVMHLRVLWNPKRDQKAEHTSGCNATVHWYVMRNAPDASAEMIEYAGTAFVLVDDSEEQREFTIRNASVRPVACRGDLRDPIGASTFAGTILATDSHKRVCEALTTVRTAVAACTTPNSGSSRVKPETPSSMVR